MDILKEKNPSALLASIIAEMAKATNEIKCAKADIAKAQGRIQFCIAVANELINREED